MDGGMSVLHVIESSYKKDEGSIVLTVRDLETGEMSYYGVVESNSQKPPISKDISIRMEGAKRCLGKRTSRNVKQSCNTSISNSKYGQCFRCTQEDFSRCFVLCNGDQTEYYGCFGKDAQRQYCYKTNRAVYVVYAGGKMKVGISFSPKNRWINQGADYAGVIAWARDGLVARRLEKYLSERLGEKLTQTISSKEKIRVLFPGSHAKKKCLKMLNTCRGLVKEGEKEINTALLQSSQKEEISVLNKSLTHQQLFSIQNTECKTMEDYYGGIKYLKERPKYRQTIPGSLIRGRIIGIKGPWMVLDNKGTLEAWNTKKMVGAIFSPAKKETKHGLNKFVA